MSEQVKDDGVPGEPRPLDYRTPPPQPAVPATVTAMRGFSLGVIMTAVAGCFAITPRVPRVAATTGPLSGQLVYPRPAWPVWFFAAVAVGAVCAFIAMRRTRPRSVFYLGMAAGVGVTALCEGLCFATQ